jgi:carboxypeptidase PM20D1
MSFASIVGICIGSAFVLIVLIALIRAITTPKAAPKGFPLPESALEEAAGVEDALAQAVRRATVSSYDKAAEDGAAFDLFKSDLKRLFPKVHEAMTREEIGDRALLYTWKGSDQKLESAIMCAHFDVVPALDAAEWKHPPFSGDLAESCVWGRGTQDIKLMLISSLHAAERLIASGFQPKRTIYFAFGGDEEIGGSRGARLIGETFASRKVKAAFLLDEGGPVADGLLAFVDRPLALIGIAEKGYMDVTVEALGSGGHASMPPKKTATGNLARAVASIESSPPAAKLGFTVRTFLGRVSSYSHFAIRLLFRNLWLFGPLVKKVFGSGHETNAMVRTTYAPTMLQGSSKENVLADCARANINVRIMPGETSTQTLDRMGSLAKAQGATVRLNHPESLVEPLPESSIDTDGFRAIEAALGDAFPDAAAVPFLFSAGTDTKHYRSVAQAMYRLTPVKQTSKQLEGVHGRDERVEVSNLRRCEIFYKRLLERL